MKKKCRKISSLSPLMMCKCPEFIIIMGPHQIDAFRLIRKSLAIYSYINQPTNERDLGTINQSLYTKNLTEFRLAKDIAIRPH